MKKVLVLAALAALVSTSAFATIVGTKHDLSAAGPAAYATDATEVCVFCHTPHGAVTSTKYTPLWNRTAAIDPTNFYTSTSMDHTTSLANTVTTDAYLCLSCHDGAQSLEALNNPPNTGLTNYSTVITGTAKLDTELNNDHPIGFIYGGSAVDNELVDSPSGISFFGPGNAEMWCSSCHDVHDDTNSPFLVIDNNGSNLCVACHVK